MANGGNKIIRRRIRNSWLSSVISTSLVLLLVGLAALLLVNADNVSDYFKENMKVSVLLRPEVGDDEAYAYRAVLDSFPAVRSTEYVSRQQGEKEMAQMLGSDFLNVFESTPIPISIDLTMNPDYVEKDSLDRIQAEIRKSPLVDDVVCQTSLLETLNQNIKKISLVLGVLIALLLFISFVLIGNTMRLTVYDRRFTIHTMKLVGATRGFIRGPFVLRSAFLGLFASLVAIILLVGVLYFIRNEFSQLFNLFTPELLLEVMGIVLASGLLICICSTYMVVGKLLSLDKDELYY
jgi:cell division transport system permease protein